MGKTVKLILLGVVLAFCVLVGPLPAVAFETDTLDTVQGDLKITFIGHGTLMFEFRDKVIHVDPWSQLADYTKLPKADLVLITHQHSDHLDLEAIKKIVKGDTIILTNKIAADASPRFVVMNNGDRQVLFDIEIKAVAAYNVVHLRDTGKPWHPKGEGNGYVLTFGRTKVYVAGDTEYIPEMNAITGVNVAFLPMNLPYTMDPEMVAEVVKKMKPQIVYPYHYGETDPQKLVDLLEDMDDVEVRIRQMQ
jgi:L-ascorbate metabolism protein UlaG (beta-lactamase superfamily)